MKYKERKKLAIESIKIPKVRITSEFDEETIAYLETSIDDKGFIEPLKIGEVNPNDYWLMDGLNRTEALKRKNILEADSDIFEATMQEVLDVNISTSLAKGRTNPLQVGLVLQEMKKQGLTDEQLAEKYGKNIAWIRLYLKIGTMEPKYQDALDRGALSVGVIEKALDLKEDPEINQALDYAMLYKYTIPNMQKYIETRKKDIEDYKERIEKLGLMEPTKVETPPESAYLSQCTGCQEKVDTRFMRGAYLCKSCLWVLETVYNHLGGSREALAILTKLITDYKEQQEYLRLKGKFEPKESEQKIEEPKPLVPPPSPTT